MTSSKAKAKGISASSFFDLKAELSKKEVDFAKAKAEGKNLTVIGGIKRPDKKPTVWARQNKGVSDRATRDVELEEISRPTLDSARSVLERKAKIYEKLRKGKTGGLSGSQYDSLLVDFDSTASTSKYCDVHSSDEDESLTVPKTLTTYDDDPLVEYEDEFGRVRTAKLSEVPRNLRVDQEQEEVDEDEDIIIRNPENHYVIYQPSEERIAEVDKKFAEENNPLNIHYDASREVRAKGAGFYQFSGDEEQRRAQMEELKTAREETSKNRDELGAEDIRPGEDEGSLTSVSGAKSRAMEKRKREIEERRKLLDEKRKKIKLSDSKAAAAPTPLASSQVVASRSTSSGPESSNPSTTTSAPPSDPFAALEAQSAGVTIREGKAQKRQTSINATDAFLSQLEHEFLASRAKR
ncbi:hypothetical protein CPB83DRAFT_801267 [Crepidotus variabilis]|uniref:Coiled-coil domain-containing protein 174 n=1 Tax=Crepidotus variabilis TaxID=179855 RepID=A0A9P6E376_9AGAR|nr:hypothetical protein CPB83DRAFT_801267 [Crepidotus variabilis]